MPLLRRAPAIAHCSAAQRSQAGSRLLLSIDHLVRKAAALPHSGADHQIQGLREVAGSAHHEVHRFFHCAGGCGGRQHSCQRALDGSLQGHASCNAEISFWNVHHSAARHASVLAFSDMVKASPQLNRPCWSESARGQNMMPLSTVRRDLFAKSLCHGMPHATHRRHKCSVKQANKQP